MSRYGLSKGRTTSGLLAVIIDCLSILLINIATHLLNYDTSLSVGIE